MVFNRFVKYLLSKKSGLRLDDGAHLNLLIEKIAEQEHERIGLNTMKRLMGQIKDEREPRPSTLNIIAHYLGFPNWEVMDEATRHYNSMFTSNDGSLASFAVPEGSLVEYTYLPDRKVTLQHRTGSTYEVVYNENSQLREGDIVEVGVFMLRFPLIVSDVVRNGQSLGSYIAGKWTGLNSLKLIEPSTEDETPPKG